MQATNVPEEAVNITVGILEGFFHEENLDNLENCIHDTDEIGYLLYDAIEDFIKGDFESIREGINYIGQVVTLTATGMEDCKDAVQIDIPKLVELGEIFTNPKELIEQIGKDILLNGRSIKNDIQAAISDFNNSNFEQMGKDIGEAAALVIFGKPHKEFDCSLTTISSNEYNAYLNLAGYAYIHKATDEDLQTLYNSANVYGEDFSAGINAIYAQGKPATDDEAVFAFHKLGFLYNLAGSSLQQNGLYTNVDFTASNTCLQSISASQLTNEMMTYVNASYDAFTNGDYKSVGQYIGAVAAYYCPLSELALF